MLADKLYNLVSFKVQYEALIILSACNSITNLEWYTKKEDLLEKICWNNLISIASALSFSDNNEHLDCALRISQTILTEQSTNKQQKEAAGVILLNLTNKPAVDLAIKRNLIDKDFQDNLPLSIKLQNNNTSFQNCIILNVFVILYLCTLDRMSNAT